MNRRLVAVFAFALAVASITSFAVYRLVVLQVRRPLRPVATNKILVAAHDLQVGELIKDSDLAEISSSGPLPEHALKTRQEAIGRGVIATIYQNEPLSERRLAPVGAGAGLAATIPVGMRAVALRVNEVVGLAGFVLPGMRVDVLISGGAGGGGVVCKTVLQNIEVLSAGQKIEKNADGKPESAQVVNLLVTPDQAEMLSLASDQTRVQLVLRNPLDTKEQNTRGVTLSNLFGQQVSAAAPAASATLPMLPRPRAAAPPPPRRVQPDTATVEVFNGTKRSDETFAVPNRR